MPPRAHRHLPYPRAATTGAIGVMAGLAILSLPAVASAVGLLFVDGGDGRSLDEARVAFATIDGGGVTWLQARSERAVA